MNLITHAIDLLRAGKILSIPTETVYGLGADASNPLALRQIFALKNRPMDHPLIVHVANVEKAKEWVFWDDKADALVENYWPGPLTLILKKRPHVLPEVSGGLDSLGIRVPNHPLTLKLLSQFKGGIAAPSANRFGRISPTTAQHVREEFGNKVFVLDGGNCEIGMESTIVDLYNGPAILRPGAVSLEEVQACIGELQSSNTIAPGTLKAHYAPKTSLFLSENTKEDVSILRSKGLKVAVLHALPTKEYGKKLYAELRRLDKEKHDVLVVERAKATGLGIAINDRLTKAATGAPFTFPHGDSK